MIWLIDGSFFEQQRTWVVRTIQRDLPKCNCTAVAIIAFNELSSSINLVSKIKFPVPNVPNLNSSSS
jgi:hypothetical protein